MGENIKIIQVYREITIVLISSEFCMQFRIIKLYHINANFSSELHDIHV